MVRILCDLIRWYQQGISAQRPFRVCRFTPSCSQYMLEALQQRGYCSEVGGSFVVSRFLVVAMIRYLIILLFVVMGNNSY